MALIQQDVTDVIARDITPTIIEVARMAKDELTPKEQEDLEQMIALLEGWNGEFSEDCVACSVYMHAQMRFYKSLFRRYTNNDDLVMMMSDGYAFFDTWQRLLTETKEQGAASHFQRICHNGYRAYTGNNHCAYNTARSLTETKEFLSKSVSQDPQRWKWIDLHVSEYINLPWSRTPLKFLMHRKVPTLGNSNTPHVAKTVLSKNANNLVFTSSHAANYKEIFTMMKDPAKDVNKYSIDTGMHGNPLQGHYFDMNRRHLEGNLHDMRIGGQIANVQTKTLVIKPASMKKSISEAKATRD